MSERYSNFALHIGLFGATCLTTTWAGIRFAHPEIDLFQFGRMLPVIKEGLSYSLSIMAILLAHEMGHYVMARWHGVAASLPYFLPVPLPMVGTMGAVIVMKGGIPSRNGLVDWAAAGPLAGLIMALPVLAWGIHFSPVLPLGQGALEGNSILYWGVKYLVKGASLPGAGLDVRLHPMAWAGWVGLLVTMINMMPIGQLDGGHLAFAYFGEKYAAFSSWIHRGLLFLAVIASGYTILELNLKAPIAVAMALGWGAGFSWIIWWALLKLMKKLSKGQYHPPVGQDQLTTGRRRICMVMMIIFILIFIPIPMRVTL